MTLKKFISYSLIIHLLVMAVILALPSKEGHNYALLTRLVAVDDISSDSPLKPEERKSEDGSVKAEKTVEQTITGNLPSADSEMRGDNIKMAGKTKPLDDRNIIPPGAGFSFPLRRGDLPERGLFKNASAQKQEKSAIEFEAKDFNYPEYLRKLKEKTERAWQYPPDAAMRGITGDLYLGFTIKRDGSLGSVVIVRSSGYGSLDGEAIKAIKDAAPYPELPVDWNRDSLDIKAHFIYRMYEIYVR